MAQSSPPHIVLLDGRSGVGKTTLATTMADSLNATVVHLDDVYPGWGGLAAGRDAVIDSVIRPLREGRAARIRLWDWTRNAPGIEVAVPSSDIVIVEGCGVSTPESRELADVSIWVECDETIRRTRQRERDGVKFEDFLDLWESQVNEHIDANKPIANATVTVRT